VATKQTLKTGFQVVAAIVVIAGVMWWIKLDEIVEVAKGADGWMLFLAFLLTPVNIWLEVLVWRPLVRAIDATLELASLLRAVLIGFAFAIITPARVGEFYGRTIVSSKENQWSVGASVVVGRVAESIIQAIVGLAALAAIFPEASSEDLNTWTVYLSAVGAIWLILLLALFFVRSSTLDRLVLGRLKKIIRPFAFLEEVELRARIEVLFFGFLRYCVFALQFAIAVRAFGIEADVLLVLHSIAIVFLLRSLAPPVSFLDLGIREGVAAFVFGYAGMSEAAAFNAALAIFAMNVLLPSLIGIPMALKAMESRNASSAALS
jgi:uncharacterized protein (TIRG00374 family)